MVAVDQPNFNIEVIVNPFCLVNKGVNADSHMRPVKNRAVHLKLIEDLEEQRKMGVALDHLPGDG